jgi:Short C-terminal domain
MGFMRRRARRRTALLVGGAAYAAGRSGRADGGYEEEPQQEVPPAPPAPAATGEGADIDELQRLGDLHTSGVLTDEEFAAAKAKILGTSPSRSGAEEQS